MERVGEKWRARRRRGNESVYGTLRETWEEADGDRSSLKFPDELATKVRKGTAPTLTEFCEHVLQNEIVREKTYGTWRRYEVVWRTRIDVHPVGKKRVDRVDEDDLQRLLDDQRKYAYRKATKGAKADYVATDEPLAPATLRTIGAFLAAVFGYAKGKRYKYVKANPAHGLEYPKAARTTRKKSLTPREAAGLEANLLKFISTLSDQGERFEAMVLVARDTGMRRAEICGLRWDRVRRAKDGPYLVIDTQRVVAKHGFKDGPTKTGNVRELPIGEDTYERIASQPRRSEYVFTTAGGRPVGPDYFTESFRAFREAMAMPDLRLHNLRHTYISLMLRAGVDVKTIQKNVGHVSSTMIMDVYGETFGESQRESVNRLRSVLDHAAEEIRSEEDEGRKEA